ncbi:MAG: flagellar basal-body MS-ring/collar protein FliF [Polyangiaceae bacterium]
MPERVKVVFEQLKAFWAGLSTPKRLALLLFTVGAAVTVLAATTLSGRPTFAYLYTELSQEDAAAIVQKLDGLKVPYELDHGGSAVKVPEERVHALRLELAGAGLPRGGGVGFEIFDKSQIGATEFEQNVNLRRALEGELSRSIATVDGVHSARVHLVMPERRLFASRDEAASASVVLKLRNAGGFGKREVAAVVHLVSAAVPGLMRDRVSVVSTEGVTLHRPISDTTPGSGDLADMHTENARAVASQLESHVREQLERVVGPGNADVRMSVMLDSRSKERTEEHYEPAKTALRSEHKVEEGVGAEEGGVAGVPGARSNLPDAVPEGTAPPEEALAGAPAGGGGVRRSHTRNWEVDKVTEKTHTPPGDIERVSVAVLLNGRYETRDGAQVYVGRSKAELAKLEQIVKTAVGFSKDRGDSVELQTLEFARLTEETGTDAPPPRWWMQYWKQLAAAAGVVVLLLSAVVLFWRSKREKKKARAAALEKAKAQLAKPGQVPIAALGDGTPSEIEAKLAKLDSAELKIRALELAAHDPATAAVVLRRWLNASTPATAPSPAR